MSQTEASFALERIAAQHVAVGREQLRLLRQIAEADRLGVRWSEEGARDLAHALAMRLGISTWKAARWVAAARALPALPRLAEALERGVLALDKVVELARFATPEQESRLIDWAERVSVGAIRHRGDLLERRKVRAERERHRARRLEWWFHHEERAFGLFAHLPAAEGAVVARAIEALAARVPQLPGEEDELFADARRADALVAMARGVLAAEPEAERATVVVHAPLATLQQGEPGAELEDGPPIHPETAARLACDARVQTIVEDARGDAVFVSPARRYPPAWMVRQLRYRDRGCVFPGCGTSAFTVAHHLRPWSRGGPTTLKNLALLCSFHHRLVHEEGWRLRRVDGVFLWRRPNGAPYLAGPPPPGGRDPEGGETEAAAGGGSPAPRRALRPSSTGRGRSPDRCRTAGCGPCRPRARDR
jgi:hypothetical protein